MKLFYFIFFILILLFSVSCTVSEKVKQEKCISGVYANSICCEQVCDIICVSGYKPNTCNCECLDYGLDLFDNESSIKPPEIPA